MLGNAGGRPPTCRSSVAVMICRERMSLASGVLASSTLGQSLSLFPDEPLLLLPRLVAAQSPARSGSRVTRRGPPAAARRALGSAPARTVFAGALHHQTDQLAFDRHRVAWGDHIFRLQTAQGFHVSGLSCGSGAAPPALQRHDPGSVSGEGAGSGPLASPRFPWVARQQWCLRREWVFAAHGSTPASGDRSRDNRPRSCASRPT